MPFDAMKGLQEALREREERHSRVEKHDISDEQAQKNSEIFLRLRKGMTVRLECYQAFHDLVLTGIVTGISVPYRVLKLDGREIYFGDIYSIEVVD